jgi:NADP-dependent 3-hydroxy acid dehydrogenase YdfG
MSDDHRGDVVWITGGGTGIGEAVALEYGDRGAKVAVSGRRLHKLKETVEQLEALGTEGLAVTCDVTDEARVEEAVARVVDEWGRLDVALANAGCAVSGDLEELSADDWRRQFDVNVVGLVSTAKYALPELRETGGRLALMGSVAGTIATPDEMAYSASKYAVRSIGQSLAVKLASSEVSCTTLQPGFVQSEIVKRDREDHVHPEWDDPRPQALIWSAERAATKIVDAIDARKREYTFTGHGRLASFFGKHAPGVVHHAMALMGEDDD